MAIDLLGPLPTGESILVVVDYHSRHYEIDIMTSTIASKVISSLERYLQDMSNGKMISRDGLKPDPDKVTAIKNMLKPTSLKFLPCLILSTIDLTF